LRKILIPVFLVTLLTLAAGCGSHAGNTTTTTPASSEPDYAHAITDTALRGLSDDNLEAYVKYGSADFKAAVTQEILDTTSKQITGQLGDYQSITYLSTETKDNYTIVHYKARYTGGEVGVRMVFDQDHKVAGQWFE
jgi:hypothetical protein